MYKFVLFPQVHISMSGLSDKGIAQFTHFSKCGCVVVLMIEFTLSRY